MYILFNYGRRSSCRVPSPIRCVYRTQWRRGKKKSSAIAAAIPLRSTRKRFLRRDVTQPPPSEVATAVAWKGAPGLRMDRRPTVSPIGSSIVRCQWTGEGQGLIFSFVHLHAHRITYYTL